MSWEPAAWPAWSCLDGECTGQGSPTSPPPLLLPHFSYLISPALPTPLPPLPLPQQTHTRTFPVVHIILVNVGLSHAPSLDDAGGVVIPVAVPTVHQGVYFQRQRDLRVGTARADGTAMVCMPGLALSAGPQLPHSFQPPGPHGRTHVGNVAGRLPGRWGHGNRHVHDGDGLRLICRWDGQLLAQALAGTLRAGGGWRGSSAGAACVPWSPHHSPDWHAGMPVTQKISGIAQGAALRVTWRGGMAARARRQVHPEPPRLPTPHQQHSPGAQGMPSPAGEPPPQPPSPASGGLGRLSWIATAYCRRSGVIESWPPAAGGSRDCGAAAPLNGGLLSVAPDRSCHSTFISFISSRRLVRERRLRRGQACHPSPACCGLNLAVLSHVGSGTGPQQLHRPCPCGSPGRAGIEVLVP